MPGSPDWQGAGQVRADALYNQTGVALGTGSAVLLNSTSVTNYPYLILAGKVAGNNGQLDVFFTSADGSNVQLDHRILVANNVFVYTLPIQLDLLQIQANRAAGAAATINLYAALTNVPYFETQLALDQILSFTSGSIAQNASTEATFFPYAGFAMLEIESTQTNFNCRVKNYDLDGATLLGRSFFATTTAATINQQAWLPATINALSLTNLNAAAAVFTAYAWAQAAVPK